MLVSFQCGLKRLLVASCLSRLQGALPSTVMLEGNSPAFLSSVFGLVLEQNPLPLLIDAYAIKHLGTWSAMLLIGIKKNLPCP